MGDSGPTSPTSHGFFSSKLQKTKQSLSKAFSKGLEKDINKSLNLSTNSSNCSSTSSFHANTSSSFSASNLTDVSMFKQSNNLIRKSSLVSSNSSLPDPSLSATSTKTNLHEIFEFDKLINDLSLSKSYSDQDQTKKFTSSIDDNYTDIDNEPAEQEVGITSVKEHAKMLNRLNTSADLRDQNEQQPKIRNNSVKDQSNKKPSAPVKNIEIESIDISNATSLEKEWLLVCSRCDYMEMAKILSKNPCLAQKKDPFTTCAHWACKYGNIEILKLIASTLENDTKTNPKSIRINNLINTRTKLFLKGAEGLVDYSGRQALEYSKSMQNNSINQEINDFKNNADTLNDKEKEKEKELGPAATAASIVKRTGSIIHRETKELFLSNNLLKSNENKHKIRAHSIRSSSYESNPIAGRAFLPPSPLAAIDPVNNSSNSALMPPPSTTTVLRAKKINNSEDIYQNEENNLRESKENIFI